LIELIRTNDLVLISRIEALLAQANIPFVLADSYMSALEGSTGFLPRRLLVSEASAAHARELLREEGLGFELRDG